MLMTLLSMLGGGVLRLLPEVFHFLNKKTDNEHELAMMDRQIQLENLKAASAEAVAKAQADAAVTVAQTQADAAITEADTKASSEALAAQFQLLAEHFQASGNRFVDGFVLLTRNGVDVLNMLVRPVTTYYFLALFGVYKAALLSAALGHTADVWEAILKVYTPDDAAMLAGTLSFWFVGRVFDRKAQ